MSVNKVILVGRLGRDPETRFTSGGQAVCNFTMATDETFKDRNGERQKRTEWHRIVLWGKLAEIAQQYLKKGQLVYIEGRIQQRQWDDQKTQQKRTSFDIVGNVMRMLTSRAESAAAGARSSGGGASAGAGGSYGGGGGFDAEGPAPPADEPIGPEVTDEDIPF
jgi:single-strand DNA-binding protein